MNPKKYIPEIIAIIIFILIFRIASLMASPVNALPSTHFNFGDTILMKVTKDNHKDSTGLAPYYTVWEEKASYLEVFPTQATYKINLKLDLRGQTAICSIYNLAGEILIKQKLEKVSEHTLDISKLPKGIYFVKVENRGEVVVKKFVKI